METRHFTKLGPVPSEDDDCMIGAISGAIWWLQDNKRR